MKILHIHTKMVSGGIEAIVCNLVNEMSKSHDVTLCTIFQPTDDDVFYRKLDNKVKKITIGKKNLDFPLKKYGKYIESSHKDIMMLCIYMVVFNTIFLPLLCCIQRLGLYILYIRMHVKKIKHGIGGFLNLKSICLLIGGCGQ